ncbi:putative adipose-regulatory protein-domain-containing protein [Tricharina praecox]|uniref:putative adipose-regulatory protein-domain-containing protein n=1 Tax=Tricharina praecox TaxID=43433 RepID=UPI00221FC0A2|nr:putative adipose-regulatory protein-domain-containing protein [Tricharina praecox]KAI5858519.1 putative adipose-regulatory protein-domain-containing protein [Tricharina praecox]
MDLLLTPLHHLFSKPARRAYLQTILLFTASITLLFIAVFSYLLFYASYVPSIGIVRPMYFSYAPTEHPTASVSFSSGELIPEQPYKITLHMTLPASPRNVEVGNFDVDLSLHSTGGVLLHTRRPGILTYRTPLLTTLRTLAFSPLLVAGLVRQEETLRIALAEAAVWTREPTTATVLLNERINVYEARLEFVASLQGLRWAMYYWPVTTFVVFVGLFWAVEVVAAGVGWWLVSGLLGTVPVGEVKDVAEKEEGEEEDEEEEGEQMLVVEDTQRTFPRVGGAPPYPTPESTPAPAGPEGDESGGSQEGDDEDGFSEDERVADSGLGTTTLSESTAREGAESVRRRRRL